MEDRHRDTYVRMVYAVGYVYSQYAILIRYEEVVMWLGMDKRVEPEVTVGTLDQRHPSEKLG